jgi:exodeoxyribonuclease VII large subunit
VSQVALAVKAALAECLPGKLRVVGEISNFSDRSHWFFSIKDEKSALRCVCFASAARRVPFRPSDGMQVVCTGRLDYYDAQGSVQLYVDAMEPVGQGALEMQLRALMAELRQAGYFEEARKKALPVLPRRVAVVTSRSAAALQDVINTAQRRWAGCQLVLLDVRVQGASAAPQIAQAIASLARHGRRLGIDAVILTRGGGSIEDLWAFNERVVADAIYRCELPIVAAIGHETDTTIAELVADVRCSTPTQAAMTLIPDEATLRQQVDGFAQRLALMVRRDVRQRGQHLEALARHPMFRSPAKAFAPARQRLMEMEARLRGATPRLVKSRGERLDALAKHLEAVSPFKVLQRGFSVTLGPDGSVVRSADAVRAGDALTTRLAEGQVRSIVADAGDRAAPPPPRSAAAASSPPRRANRKPANRGDQGALF